MTYFGGMDSDERGMLHDLVLTFAQKCNALQRLNEDLTRQLESERERVRLLEAAAYGLF